MASVSAPPSGAGEPLRPPVAVLLTGLAAVAVAAGWNVATPDALEGPRALLIALALVAVGAALALLLPTLRDDGEGRLAAGGLWALAAAAGFVGSFGVGPSWGSIAFLFRLLAGVGVIAAVVSAVPNAWRLFLGSLLIVLHFAAIFCAITVVPPPNGPAPFLAAQSYVRYFHPYLVATNLNNGYHFYAPEPGPCALLWFRVQWADGASAWVRMPDHPKMANHLQRRRLGALATAISQGNPLPNDPEWRQRLLESREKAGAERKIPPDPRLPLEGQYREPNPTCKLLLSSFARFVAKDTPHPAGAEAAVTGVKVYSVDYWNPVVEHFQAGRDPLDPSLYVPTYVGDFHADGALKAECFSVAPPKGPGKPPEVTQDPFLYWRIPIVRELPPPPPGMPPDAQSPWAADGKTINYVRLHAGDKDEGTIP